MRKFDERQMAGTATPAVSDRLCCSKSACEPAALGWFHDADGVGDAQPRAAVPQGGTPQRAFSAEHNPRTRQAPRLTVMIIALNEEKNLPGLLERLRGIDEIVLVDGGSGDRTLEIARSCGARVFVRAFDTFARQQNFALSLASGEWVLSLDADERPTPAMLQEVRRRISSGRHDAYRVRVRSSIFGRAVRFSGTQDDRQVRLVRRGSAAWRGEVHETLETPGRVGQLQHWLDHNPLPDLGTFLAKMNRYTRLAAEARVARHTPPCRHEGWLAPPREIFRRLVWKQGFWDGPQGWAFCLLSGLSQWVLADQHRRLWKQAHSALSSVS